MIVALELAVRFPAVAVKVAVLDPERALTVAGTVRRGLFELSATLAPEEPAAPLRFTVQVLAALDPREVGLQVKVLSVRGATTETDPSIPVTAIAFPIEEAPKEPVTPIAADPGSEDMVSVTVATIPLLMILAFKPLAIQM